MDRTKEKRIEETVGKMFKHSDIKQVQNQEIGEGMNLEDEEDIEAMRKIKEERAFNELQEKQEKKNEVLNIAYRVKNKDQ